MVFWSTPTIGAIARVLMPSHTATAPTVAVWAVWGPSYAEGCYISGSTSSR